MDGNTGTLWGKINNMFELYYEQFKLWLSSVSRWVRNNQIEEREYHGE